MISKKKEKIRLSGSFESLMMSYSGKSSWDHFKMRDAAEFASINGEKHCSPLLMSRFNLVPRTSDPGNNPKKRWYFYADFVKPTGKIEIMKVKSSLTNENTPAHIQPFVPKAKFNDFKVTLIEKKKSAELKRMETVKFRKERSVFEPWKEDTAEILQKCAQSDFLHWKVPTLCKDEGELGKVEDVILKHYSTLKHLFYSLISCEEYPHIKWMNYTKFCDSAKLLED